MNILKAFVLGGIVFLILLLIVAAFIPAEFSMSREVEINQDAKIVFNKVSDFNQWSTWSPWHDAEPTAKWELSGKAATVGHKLTWIGEKIGEGALTIQEVTAPSYIKSSLEFAKPAQMSALDLWSFESKGSKSTLVRWTHTTKLRYPTERIMRPFLDKMIGATFENGLAKLKRVLETAP